MNIIVVEIKVFKISAALQSREVGDTGIPDGKRGDLFQLGGIEVFQRYTEACTYSAA